MQAIPSAFRAAPARQAGLIVAAVLAAAALAAGALLLEPRPAFWTSSAGSEDVPVAPVPPGMSGDSAVSGDPSVPSAASVFKDKDVLPEEPVVSF